MIFDHPEVAADCGHLRAAAERTKRTLCSTVPDNKLYDAFGMANKRTPEGLLLQHITAFLKTLDSLGY